MKAITNKIRLKLLLIIATFIGIGIGPVHAKSIQDGPDGAIPPSYNLSFLAPGTPAEADFNDEVVFLTDFHFLTPVTPIEADFDEENETSFTINSFLVPVTPAEACFDEDK